MPCGPTGLPRLPEGPSAEDLLLGSPGVQRTLEYDAGAHTLVIQYSAGSTGKEGQLPETTSELIAFQVSGLGAGKVFMVWQCHLLASKGSTEDVLQEVILMTDLSGQTRWDSLALLNPGKTWQVENSYFTDKML